MKINVEITGMKELQSSIAGLSQRRLNAVVATALTRTVKAVQGKWTSQLNSQLDRPIDRTLNAVAIKPANAQNLQAEVFIKDRMPGTAPAAYLAPQEAGGNRLLKKFERALVNSGAMPAGYLTVPGKHATLDSYGNVSRAQLVAVVRALGLDYSPGYAQVISKSTAKRLASQAKHGRKYIAVTPQEARKYRLSPGIYERMADGSRKAIFLFKRAVQYRKRLNLVDRASVAAIEREAQSQLTRALDESLERLASKGAP